MEWYTLVWFKGRLPRAAFFLWLVVKEKLGTQDRLFHPVPGILCLFCGACLETHEHLFFECTVIKQIWTRILHKGNFSTPDLPWKERVSWMATHWHGDFCSVIKKLCLAISVYYIWKERNTRFHTNSTSSIEEVFCSIVEQVRMKLSTLRKVEDNPTNHYYQFLWNLPDGIFGL